jgi:hypothetical protein
MTRKSVPKTIFFDPLRWGLPDDAFTHLGDDLYDYWEWYCLCFRARTRDTSAYAHTCLHRQLTLEDARDCANIDRRLNGGDGQSL